MNTSLSGKPNPNFLILAGEVSGDLWGSLLVEALRSQGGPMNFIGTGLKRMQGAGVRLFLSPEEMARFSVIGTLENIGKLPGLFRLKRKILTTLKQEVPQAAILIDYPGFNLRLVKPLFEKNIPLFYYAPPQVWLWGKWRIKVLRKYFKKLLVFFPFEKEFYHQENIQVDWVGHPLIQCLNEDLKADPLGLGKIFSGAEVIGLLPGSRLGMIRRNLPPLLQAAKILHAKVPNRLFFIPLAPLIPKHWLESLLGDTQPYVRIIESDTFKVLSYCRSAISVTGTATLEAALCGVPTIVCGKISRFDYFLATTVLKIRAEGNVNRLLKEKIFPEFWQREMTPDRLASEMEALLADPDRNEKIKRHLKNLRTELAAPGNASYNAAKAILNHLH